VTGNRALQASAAEARYQAYLAADRLWKRFQDDLKKKQEEEKKKHRPCS